MMRVFGLEGPAVHPHRHRVVSGAAFPAGAIGAFLTAFFLGLIAHLYGLTEDEFAHIPATFPIVPEADKQAAMEAFKAFYPKSDALPK